MTEKTCHGLDLSLFDEVTFRFHVENNADKSYNSVVCWQK